MQNDFKDRQNQEKTSSIRDEVQSVHADVETPETEMPPIIGVVTDCMKLNLREEASSDAAVLTEIPALTEVVVDLDASTDAFYKVCTAAGIQGFCMKKYIAIRR